MSQLDQPSLSLVSSLKSLAMESVDPLNPLVAATSSSEGVTTMPDSVSVPKEKKKVQRLKKEGMKVITDFFENVTQNPTSEQKREVLKQVQRVPGCEWYTYKQLGVAFVNRRKAARDANNRAPQTVSAVTEHDILYPTLKEVEKRARLDVLLESHPNPTADAIAIWAPRVGASTQDISTYIQMKRALQSAARPSSSRCTPDDQVQMDGWENSLFLNTWVSHLPTPSQSTSPEPSLLLQTPVTPHTPTIPPHLPSAPSQESPQSSTVIDSQHQNVDLVELLKTLRGHMDAGNYGEFATALVEAGVVTKDVAFPEVMPDHNSLALPSEPLQEISPPLPTQSDQPGLQIRQLATIIRKSLSEACPMDVVPKTAADFVESFAPYGEMITEFSLAVEEGRYRDLGWIPRGVEDMDCGED
ncbi:hypothetical protein JAAARDRAFT_70695 [Jaapia argillacea MUCL 33604]|uniref:Uncharacterized protein n=1 Tax=Jaapia argillacea MUCL 33604 TaxID=933084 RepID=A0A067Q1C7_9AGAM|nr:hypothetical protein JAAARDRAFT_70695 [Jaapia argillacea MUCL 33604]